MTEHPLIAFLRARLNEDEQTARDGEDACWHVDYCDDLGPSFHERFAPDRVLADITAKRTITDEFERCGPHTQGHSGLLAAVQILALPYASHPDYREEWKP